MAAKRFPLPKRFSAALSGTAYKNLRDLNEKYHYGNNYLLTILLENLDKITNSEEMEKVFRKFREDFGAPSEGGMTTSGSQDKKAK